MIKDKNENKFMRQAAQLMLIIKFKFRLKKFGKDIEMNFRNQAR